MLSGYSEIEHPVITITAVQAQVAPVAGASAAYNGCYAQSFTSSGSDNTANVKIGLPTGLSSSITYNNGSNAIATVPNGGGTISRLSDGTVDFNVVVPNRGKWRYQQSIARVGGTTSRTWLRWLAVAQGDAKDSLATALINSVTSLLYGKSFNDTSLSRFSANPYVSSNGSSFAAPTPNTSRWLAPASCDLSGLSFNGAVGGGSMKQKGILVGPRHCICAMHFAPAVGTVFYWLGTDSVVRSATVTSVTSINNSDLGLVLLNAALPGTVTPFKVAPASMSNKLPARSFSMLGVPGIPVAWIDQADKIYITGFAYNQNALPAENVECGDPGGIFSGWQKNIVVGDSGSPVFLPLSVPVLVGAWHYSSGVAPFVADYISQLNTLMNSQVPGSSLTIADFSAYA